MLKQGLDDGSREVAASLEADIFLLFAGVQKIHYYVGSQISVFAAFPFRFVMVMLYFVFLSS